MSSSSPCPDESQVHLFLAGELEPALRNAVLGHAASCNACCVLLAALVGADGPPPSAGAQHEPRAPRPRAQGDTVPAPKLLGRFEVIAKLGEGGMGAVYDALDPELDRRVAVKVIRFGTADMEARMRLLREARAMAKIAHPNVVAVYEVGHHGDETFVVMERIEGLTLTKWLDAAPRTPRDILETMADAGRGLAAVHAAGMVHRDFKPDNVIVGTDGRVRVLDFGLARLRDPARARTSAANVLDLELTAVGAIVGTPSFMAPEQLMGRAADARSDQFAFGVALYRALYRVAPFEGRTVELLAKAVCSGEVRSPPAHAAVPSPVVGAMMRALAVHPGERFMSVDAMVAEIDRALAAPAPTAGDLDIAGALRRRVAGVGLAGGLLVLFATFARDGARISASALTQQALLAFALMLSVVVVFRRLLFRTTYDRAVWALFGLPVVALNLSCLALLPRGVPVHWVLLGNTTLVGVAMGVGALTVEPWLAANAVVCLVYAGLLGWLGERAMLGFPVVQFFGIGLALYVWRERRSIRDRDEGKARET